MVANAGTNRVHRTMIYAVLALATGLALLFTWPLAGAQTVASSVYPSRPIKIVVTFPPGGGTDMLARKLGERLMARSGQPVLIENRPGASGNIGARVVADSEPDGYTLLMVNSSFAINPAVFKVLPFSPAEDFTAVINVAFVPSVWLVPALSAARTLSDWLSYATPDRPQPYGSCGNGTPQHMAGEMLARVAGRSLQQIPYKGCGPALAAAAGGQVGAAIVTASAAASLIESGQVHALAITSAQRSPLLPEVPTVAEQGWPDYQLDQWHGLLAPAGTPPEVIAWLNTELTAIVLDPVMQASLRALGFHPAPGTSAQFQAMINADLLRFADLAQQIGLRMD